MRLILGGINGDYLRNLIEGAGVIVEGARVTESVWAAVAYATDAKDSGSLVRWCFDNDIPLKFWGQIGRASCRESVSVRVDLGVRCIINKKQQYTNSNIITV